jgi:hypothetical protein
MPASGAARSTALSYRPGYSADDENAHLSQPGPAPQFRLSPTAGRAADPRLPASDRRPVDVTLLEQLVGALGGPERRVFAVLID